MSHLVSNSSNFSKSTPILTSSNCKTVEDIDGYPGTYFFKYWDFHPLLWKGISGCTVRLFNSQGTTTGLWSQRGCFFGCTSDGVSVWGFGPAAPNIVLLLLKTNGLTKGFLRCYSDSLSSRCSCCNSSPAGRKHLGFKH